MDEVIFTFNSVTYANKAKKILARVNVQSKLVKLTASNDGGCVHGLSISRADYFTAVAALRETAVNYKVIKSGYGLF